MQNAAHLPAPSGTKREEARQLLKLAAPIALLHLSLTAMGSIGTIVTGRVSAEAQAGVGLGMAVFFGIMVVGLGLTLGFDPLFSQAIGAREHERTDELLVHGLRFAFRVSIPIILVLVAIAHFLPTMGFDGNVGTEAKRYLLGRAPSLVPMLLSSITRAYLQAHERTRPLLVAAFLANLVMLPTAILLVHVLHLGALGTGIATSIATTVILLTEGVAIYWKRPQTTKSVGPSGAVYRRAFRVGGPLALQLFAEVSAFAGTTVLMGYFGTRTLAAHQIAMESGSLSFQVVLALGVAASVRVGHCVGRGDIAGARRVGVTAMLVGLSVNALATVLFLAFPDQITRAFNPDPELLAPARAFLFLVGIFQLADGLQTISSGALRGAGETRTAMFGNLVGHYLLGVPVGLFLAYRMGFGPTGLWYGLTVGLTAVALLLTYRFYRLTRGKIARV